ncbi:Slp family lipoprotein [Crenothrix polyspora]|uniref:Starvation lipoprotein Slp paralog n=1 Tax=Crenothrix polyspora TaxID=360316 RepID=A0A1R4H6J4_9GAMM|nr:Slp family lipoprotein [Crenothrix polyspora]SJM91872.1 Starvation lipoprotein Slp paralog [Crenothrix polyspora]
MKKYLISSCLLLSACSNLPRNIENTPSIDISYSQAMQNINSHKNTVVRWGGVIIDVENKQYQSFIQVLLYPLNSYGRPQIDQSSGGRFIIQSSTFLDPIVYTKNTEVTVFGPLAGDTERTVDKRILKLPVVLSQTIFMWPKYEPDNYYNSYGGFGGFGSYGGYYGGMRGGWGGYPYYGSGYYSPSYGPHHRHH